MSIVWIEKATEMLKEMEELTGTVPAILRDIPNVEDLTTDWKENLYKWRQHLKTTRRIWEIENESKKKKFEMLVERTLED